ncbi:NAD(P)H-quinone oxidoreductase [Parvularcula sp. IMCC14364]|uniref:NAD(P)H-quinone oxidoreductase n=1 Tax=Parvularcula sp. IMCC14364 TaxID=3067902 RepID=UPI0027405A84|nr:NAD(P)H-quinone oxidoreductase [Parvularcula sp. IMCC14364]
MTDVTHMTAVEISAPGGPEVLQSVQRPVPQPGDGAVLIRVAAAGVNRPDILQRMGLYPPPAGASDLPGLEVAGEVVALGAGVEESWLGRKVCALMAGGGYADYAVADAGLCLPVPDALSMIEAAALPETFFTVWTNVFEDGRLNPGERLLVHGGTSGIGTTAIELAHAFGAEVVTTAGSDDKCQTLKDMGVAAAFNYKSDDWEKLITEAGGVDVVLDMVGGDYVAKNLNCLKTGGRHVSIAFLGGLTAQINIMQIMRGRLTVTGSTLRARDPDEKARIASVLKDKVWPLLNAGKIKPVIDSTFPLAQANQAHALMEASSHIGKIVLTTES